MTVFDIANVIGRTFLTLLVVYKLAQFREMANVLERLGLGMMGAGSFLTVPVILYKYNNPFEGWSVSILTFGAIIFLVGRTWRDRRHSQANELQVKRSREYLERRGML